MKKDPAVILALTLLCAAEWSCGGGGGSPSSPTAPLPPQASTEWTLSITVGVRNTVTSNPTLLEASVWLDGQRIGSAQCPEAEPCNAIGVHANAITISGTHRIELRVDRQKDSPNDYGAGGGASVWVVSKVSGLGGIRHGSLADRRDRSVQTDEGFSWMIQFA